MHSDYSFHKKGAPQSISSARKPATSMPDLPMKRVPVKSQKPRTKREREATIYERSFGERLKAFVTGKAPKKLTKRRRRK